MAVEAWHPNVEQHDVRSKVAYRPDGLYAVVSDSRLMTEPSHRLVEDIGNVRLVVDDQDADLVVGHGPILHSRSTRQASSPPGADAVDGGAAGGRGRRRKASFPRALLPAEALGRILPLARKHHHSGMPDRVRVEQEGVE